MQEASNLYRFKWPALFGICILAFTAFLDNTIVNTALPFIQRAFHANIFELQWISNIFPIILSMTMIAVGKLGDFFGLKRTFYVGVILFGLAALFAGLSPTIEWLIFFRGVQALGASITFIASSSIISHTFPPQEREWAIGIYGGVSGAGLMLGPFSGGILVGALDWRWVFWINLPLILTGICLCLIGLKKEKKKERNVHMDWKGLFLLIFGLGSLIYGIISVATAESHPLLSWGMLIFGISALIGLIYIDTQTKDPLLNLPMFRNNLLKLAVLSCAVAGCVSYVFMFFNPLLLKDVFDLSPYNIGYLIAIIPAAQVLISFGFKPILNKFGIKKLFLISSLSPLLSALLLTLVSKQTQLWYFIIPYALLGINWGLSNTAMITTVNKEIPPTKIGEAIGTNATVWNITGAILLAFSAILFQGGEGKDFLSSFHLVMKFNALFIALTGAASLFFYFKVKK